MARIKPISKYEHVKGRTNTFEENLDDILQREEIPDSFVEQDLAAVFLVNATTDIEELEEQVLKFTGPHKNNAFYDFQNSATKLIFALDGIDVSGNSEAKKARYDFHRRLTKLSDWVEIRIHEKHSECDECIQVKNLTHYLEGSEIPYWDPFSGSDLFWRKFVLYLKGNLIKMYENVERTLETLGFRDVCLELFIENEVDDSVVQYCLANPTLIVCNLAGIIRPVGRIAKFLTKFSELISSAATNRTSEIGTSAQLSMGRSSFVAEDVSKDIMYESDLKTTSEPQSTLSNGTVELSGLAQPPEHPQPVSVMKIQEPGEDNSPYESNMETTTEPIMESREWLGDTDNLMTPEKQKSIDSLNRLLVPKPDTPITMRSIPEEQPKSCLNCRINPLSASGYSESGESHFSAGERTVELKELSESFCKLQISPSSDNCDEGDSQPKYPEQKNSLAKMTAEIESMDMENHSRGREANVLLDVSVKPQMEENTKTLEPPSSTVVTEAKFVRDPIEIGVDASNTTIWEENIDMHTYTTNMYGNAPSAEELNYIAAGYNHGAASLLQYNFGVPSLDENHCSSPEATKNHPSSSVLQVYSNTLENEKVQRTGAITSSATEGKRSTSDPSRRTRHDWEDKVVPEMLSPAGSTSIAAIGGNWTKGAVGIVLSRYQRFMEHKISHSLLTDNCVEKFHKIYMDSVCQALSKTVNSRNQFNHPYEVQQVEIQKMLEDKLVLYKKMNRENLLKMAKLRKKLLQECEKEYHTVMSGLQESFKVHVQTLQYNHDKGVACALKILMKDTHKFNPSLLNAWTKEITSKLESSGQRYIEENNAKDDPPMAPEIPRGSCEKEKGIPIKTPCGVSIFLAQENIRVGVYVNSSGQMSYLEYLFLPLIAFTEERVLISNDAKRHKPCLHVHLLLNDRGNSDKTFSIHGKNLSLKVEAILALYFHGLRVELESLLRHRIESCVMAISGLLTSRAKQLLKTSLGLAGFKRNVLLPNSTAMALSYVMQRKMEGNERFSDRTLLVVYQGGDTLETARVHVSLTNVKVERINGFRFTTTKETSTWSLLGWSEIKSEKTAHAINDVLANEVVKQAIVIFDRLGSCNENVAGFVRKELNKLKIEEISMDEHVDITSLCATLDASQNPAFEGDRPVFPVYANAAPYSISFYFNDEGPYLIMQQNDELYDNLNRHFRVNYTNPPGTLIVTERSILHENENVVDVFTFKCHHSKFGATISVNSEGCCWVEAGMRDNPNFVAKLETASTFMIPSERSTSMAAIRDILMKGEERNTQAVAKLEPPIRSQPEKPAYKQMEKPDESSNSSMKSSTVDGDPISEIRQKLSQLVEDVKMKIKGDNGATNAGIIERINATILQCEKLLRKPDVKIMQLEVKFKVLETHAKLILRK